MQKRMGQCKNFALEKSCKLRDKIRNREPGFDARNL